MNLKTFFRKKPHPLDAEIQHLLESMIKLNPNCEDYDFAVQNLERLMKARSLTCEQPRLSWDTVLTVLGNLAGILLILNFEKMDVVRSKAIGFILKAKL